MILEWGGTPEYKTWTDQPVYRTFKLSQLLEKPEEHLREKMHARVTIDVPITFEEANFIREQFIPQFKLRELMLIPEKVEVDSNIDPIDISFESVDTIVMNQIEQLDSQTYDKKLLAEIYRETMIKIKDITVKNFMSVGNQTQAIDFDKGELTLVLGENLDLGGDDSGFQKRHW